MLHKGRVPSAVRVIGSVVGLVIGLLVFAPVGASGTVAGPAEDESGFVGGINAVRAQNGLPPLASHPTASALADSWAAQLAADGALSHTPDLTAGLENLAWLGTGENVGRASLSENQVQILVDAFVASPAHFDNIVGDYTHIGVGVVYADGQIWTAHRFLKLSKAPATTTTTTTTTAPPAPPATQPPAPPATQPQAPPATQPTAPPATQAPVTQAPATQAPATQAPANPTASQQPSTPDTPDGTTESPVPDFLGASQDGGSSSELDAGDETADTTTAALAAWGLEPGDGDGDADRGKRIRPVLAALTNAAA